ncbi:MAG: hypothetical protein ACR2FU_06835 [Streptosporangiaceae bacterium]
MRLSRCRVGGAVLAAALLTAGATAGCGPSGANRTGDHGVTGLGTVVAYLPIPYRVSSEADTGSARTIRVAVRPGQRFAVKVATSDGPFVWRQVGPAPDGRLVRFVGDVNAGHCAKAAVGCRVPYFHVLRARAAGATTMTWLYRELACSPVRKKMTQSTRSCVAAVTFDITVR